MISTNRSSLACFEVCKPWREGSTNTHLHKAEGLCREQVALRTDRTTRCPEEAPEAQQFTHSVLTPQMLYDPLNPDTLANITLKPQGLNFLSVCWSLTCFSQPLLPNMSFGFPGQASLVFPIYITHNKNITDNWCLSCHGLEHRSWLWQGSSLQSLCFRNLSQLTTWIV